MAESRSSSEIGSVTEWIDCLKNDGDRQREDAAQFVWERFCRRLVGLVRAKLRSSRRVADEEDVVQQAFHNFFLGVKAGKFPQLQDSDDLWKLLVTITDNVFKTQRRDLSRIKRGQDRVRGDSAIAGLDSNGRPRGFDHIPDLTSPTAEFAETLIWTCEELFVGLTDKQTTVVFLKYEGHTNEEIAGELGCSVSSIERKLKEIRDKWMQHRSHMS